MNFFTSLPYEYLSREGHQEKDIFRKFYSGYQSALFRIRCASTYHSMVLKSRILMLFLFRLMQSWFAMVRSCLWHPLTYHLLQLLQPPKIRTHTFVWLHGASLRIGKTHFNILPKNSGRRIPKEKIPYLLPTFIKKRNTFPQCFNFDIPNSKLHIIYKPHITITSYHSN